MKNISNLRYISNCTSILATEQAAKVINEIKEVRNKEGQRARFEAVFAGNPKPEVNWFFKGKQVEESENIQIKVSICNTIYLSFLGYTVKTLSLY